MRYAQITPFEVCNGEGIGCSLFVQGCPFRCKGCFNKESWDFNGGNEWTKEIKTQFFEAIDKPYIQRVSILGGEPLADENISVVLNLIKEIKFKYPQKTIWLYTGYTLEKLCEMHTEEVIYNYLTNNKDKPTPLKNLQYVDVLVDGRYIDKLKDLTLKFRGSSNQRIIDIKQTLKQKEGKIILYK